MLLKLLGVGIDDDHAAVPSMMTVSPPLTSRDVPKPHHRRNAHRAGDDRGVARASADIRRKTLHMQSVQRGGLRGQQIVRNHHHVAASDAAGLMLLPDQVVQQPPFDVVNVLDPLGEVMVRHRQKTLAIPPHDRADRILRRVF